MPRVVFGRVVNVSERTIAKVESAAQQVEKLRQPYNEVYRLYEALAEVVEQESLGIWFVTASEAFGGLKPIEVVERGEIDRLWDMVFRLRSGMPESRCLDGTCTSETGEGRHQQANAPHPPMRQSR